MERFDNRTSRMHDAVIRSRHKDKHYRRMLQKKLYDESDAQEDDPITSRTDDEDDDEDRKKGKKIFGESSWLPWLPNSQNGICFICHCSIGDAYSDPNVIGFEGFSCPRGHLLCLRCVKQFCIRTDVKCVFCGMENEQPSANYTHRSGTKPFPFRSDRIHRESPNNQSVHTNSKEHDGPWSGHNVPLTEKDTKKDYELNSVIVDAYTHEGKEPDNVREFTVEDEDRQYQRSYCNIIKKQDRTQYTSEMKINTQIASECSRRPIRCPRIDCAVNVAFSALTHHFLFDHPEVPILNVEPGAESTLIISFAALACDAGRCLALLLVSGKLSNPTARLFNGSQINPKYRNRLPLPVLAARLHCTNHFTPNGDVHASGEGQSEGEIIIVWVAGMNIGNTNSLRCSIQAVDNVENGGVRALTYTGPINSLRTAQHPREVFATGDCIVLHEGLINHITSGCTSLNINVIVH